MKEHLFDGSVMNNGKVDVPLLLLGLMYRNVSCSMEVEPGEKTNAPLHLIQSPLGIQELNRVEELINGLSVPHLSLYIKQGPD